MTTDDRILVLMPAAKDGERTQHALAEAGLEVVVCRDLDGLTREIKQGAGLALLTEEAVAADRGGSLQDALRDQPPWSDFPLVVLAREGESRGHLICESMNVTLVERPVKIRSLLSVLQAGLRSRRRQYEVRDHLEERRRSGEAKALLAAIVESSEDAIISKDLSGTILSWNVGAERLFGYTSGEAVGRSITLVIPPDRLDEEPQILERLRRGERVEHFETVRMAKGGRLIDISLTISPVRNADGQIIAASKVARDVTARKRAEASVREGEGRFRALVTATSDAVYRMSADWAEVRHLVGGEFIAEAGGPSRSWVEKYIYPDDRPRVVASIREAIRTRSIFEMEHRVVRVDGTLGWTFSRAVPLLDDKGEIVEWFGAASDVTARKQAEEALARVTEESERRKRLYEAILSSTPDFVYVFSLDHRVLYANDALVAMWGVGNPVGKTFLEIGYEPWHADLHVREIDQVRATKKPIRGEVPFTGTNGRKIYDYIFVPVIGTDGEVEAVAGTTRDVTDRKTMEEELRDAGRKKDDFIALLAHELRNPLAPIRNGLQVIRMSEDKDVRRDSQGMMERQLSHMVRLIDDLLDVSRINRNKMELRRARMLLADAVSSAVETARPVIDSEGHELTVSLPGQPVFLDADLTRLAQVFSNLLTNSAKYTPRGGRIWLSAERRAGEVAVSIRDTGIGIPADSLGKIFNMFSQVDRSVERSTGGLGIGLALVKGLVEMHGGRVTAESAGEGAGSTFTVTLPVLADRPDLVEKPGVNGQAAGSRGRRILVVDDNRDGADSLALMLSLMGNEIRTANDGIAAVEAASEFLPEVVLMDVGMPRLNGLDATRRIRDQAWGKDMTIIALTGWGQENDRERSREAGCDGHLVKPVNLPDLEKILTGVQR